MTRLQVQSVVATLGPVGRMRPGPGTWGSLVALLLALPLDKLGGRAALGAAAACAFAAGLWASGGYARAVKRKDPSEVVIDEVTGMWLVFVALPLNEIGAVAGFALFRLFDIAKPWPISWLNRSVSGSLGIMMDDLAAALAAIACYWTVMKVI
jgi:phosphatidylglycerophosphatase A